jgi:hypothetical protein
MAENRLMGYLETVEADCGAWLTAMPSQINDTELFAMEFRDELRMRFGLQPNNLPEQCDGCIAQFSVDHATPCNAAKEDWSSTATTMWLVSGTSYGQAP